jgi:hypothetical protein
LGARLPQVDYISQPTIEAVRLADQANTQPAIPVARANLTTGLPVASPKLARETVASNPALPDRSPTKSQPIAGFASTSLAMFELCMAESTPLLAVGFVPTGFDPAVSDDLGSIC